MIQTSSNNSNNNNNNNNNIIQIQDQISYENLLQILNFDPSTPRYIVLRSTSDPSLCFFFSKQFQDPQAQRGEYSWECMDIEAFFLEKIQKSQQEIQKKDQEIQKSQQEIQKKDQEISRLQQDNSVLQLRTSMSKTNVELFDEIFQVKKTGKSKANIKRRTKKKIQNPKSN